MAEKQAKQLKKKGLSRSVKTFIIVAIVTVVLAVGGFTTYTLVANKQNEQANVVFQQTYNITYILDGGENSRYNSETYKPGDEITLQPASKEGSLFLGWYTDANFENQIKKITRNDRQDFTLYAKWGSLDLEVNYELDGGYNDIDNPYMFHYGDEDILLKDASKYGYTFKGWYTEQEFTNKVTLLDTHTTNNVTLYAKFEITNYSIVYKVDDQVYGTESFNINDMAQIVIPTIPAKVGYTAEWDKDITLENLVIEAIYTPIEYTITYNTDGAENSQDNPSTYTIEDASIPLVNLTKTGYTFGGWYTESEFTNRIYTIDTTSAQNYTLYAKWEVTIYYATFVANGEVAATIPFSIENMVVTAPAVPTRIGYTGEWQEYEVTLQNFAVTAEYTIVTYTITYNLNGGTNNQSNPTSFTVNDQDITLEDATMADYTFLGWYLDNQYAEQITVIDTATAHDYVLYAKFDMVTYTATFIADGIVVETKTFTQSNPTVTSPSVPSKKGYNKAWEEYTIDPNNLHDITINAVYTLVTYTIYYKMYDGTNNANNPTSYTVEDANITLLDPTKNNYDFMGWYTEPEFENQITIVDTSKAKRYNIYAKWVAHIYYATFIADEVVVESVPFSIDNRQIEAPNVPYKKGYTGTWGSYSTTILADFNVLAEYTIINYTITYNLDGGTNNSNNPRSYTVNSSNITLQDASLTGYNFLGWYLDSEFTNRIEVIQTGSAQTYTLYAKFDIPRLNVNYYYGNTLIFADVATTIRQYKLMDNYTIGDVKVTKWFVEGDAVYWAGKKLTFTTTDDVNVYVNAFEDNATDFTYTIDNSVATITGYTGTSEDVIIPSKIIDNGTSYNVVYIGDDAFNNNQVIKTVFIPKSVKYINDGSWDYHGYNSGSFAGCKNLKEIILTKDSALKKIGANAFASCINLKEMVIPDKVQTLGAVAFYDCSALQRVNFVGDSVCYNIGASCFQNCYSLQYINLPYSLVTLNAYAFMDCFSLQSVDISNVRNIWESTFYGCRNLISVNISNITKIARAAFQNCSSLAYIDLSGVENLAWEAFVGCSSLTSIFIPSSVTSIGDDVFKDCTGLISAEVYALDIEGGLFYGCTSLREVYLSDALSEIGFSMFGDCSSLTSITIPSSVTSIGYSAFRNCSSLTSITIPSGVTSIGDSAFYGCYKLVQIRNLSGLELDGLPSNEGQEILTNASDEFINTLTIGDKYITYQVGTKLYLMGLAPNVSVTEINDLNSLGITDIYQHAFRGCSSLTSITIPNSVTSIGSNAFSGCSSLINITIPNSVTSIGYSAFSGCYKLVQIRNLSGIVLSGSYDHSPNLPSNEGQEILTNASDEFVSILTIGNKYITYQVGAKKYLMGLAPNVSVTEINDLDGLCITDIYKNAFYNNKTIKSIVLPSGVTNIGTYAFERCSSLTSITIPASVISIGEYLDDESRTLTNVYYNGTIENWCAISFSNWDTNVSYAYAKNFYILDSSGDVTYNGNTYKLLTEWVIPEGITEILGSANYNFNCITSITIPASVTRISMYAFDNSSLKSVYYNGTIEQLCGIYIVGSHVGNYMDIGTEFYILDSSGDVTYNSNTYKLLTELVIPEGVTRINNYAFINFGQLTKVVLPSTLISIGSGRPVFSRCFRLVEVVNKSSLPITVGSSNSGGGVAQWAIQVITDETNTKLITSNGVIYYVDGADKIAVGTIDTKATNIVLDADCTEIRSWAFAYCRNLISITIPTSVTKIGANSINLGGGATYNYAFSGCDRLASVTFQTTSGWKRENTLISSSDLSSKSTAARYLKDYCYSTWTRS